MDFLVLIIVLVLGFIVIGFLIMRKQSSSELLEVVKMLKDTSTEERKLLLDSLQRNTSSLNIRLDSATHTISEVQKALGEVKEIGRSMKDLQDFLKSPKLRGNIGEQVLKELLLQMLPKESFHLQYTFKNGERVDAAIQTSAGIVPIDSKFPLENFRRMSGAENDVERLSFKKVFEKDVRLHIEAISRKYIAPEEGTIDYALMYIPSEAVYYEIVNSADLFDYASRKRVLPVSPTTFYAYMRAILMSFEGNKVEAKAKEILTSLRAIQKDYEKMEENLSTLSRHVGNTFNMMATVYSSFTQLGQNITHTKSLGEENSNKKKLIEGE